jgi:glucose-6-phosphate 1-dehydrogenase
MTSWTFLLLGITGDLAKRKVLPALAQFVELQKDTLSINLYGYSRSEPDPEQIEAIVTESTQTKTNPLNRIEFIQGQYDNALLLDDFVRNQKENERLIVYLAVPPSIFTVFLQNSCSHAQRPLDIIIEKPFGRNLQEAEQIMEIINHCTLHENVHFFDHYLFKNATMFDAKNLQQFDHFKTKTLESVSVKALENLDVKERGGYYNETGALKDMLPHLISLVDVALHNFSLTSIDNFDVLEPQKLVLGQYENYQQDLELETPSQTDSYFQTTLEYNGMHIQLESGKKLGSKLTEVTVHYTDGTTLEWNLSPEQTLCQGIGDNKSCLTLWKNHFLDHTNLFHDLLEQNYRRFVSPQNILSSWRLYEKLLAFQHQNNLQPAVYQDDSYPPRFHEN